MLVARNVFHSLARAQQTKTALSGAIAQYTTAKGHHCKFHSSFLPENKKKEKMKRKKER